MFIGFKEMLLQDFRFCSGFMVVIPIQLHPGRYAVGVILLGLGWFWAPSQEVELDF